MLFDLRGRGRRRTVQVIYLGLAILLGGGLVLFGIGSSSSGGGIVDAVIGDGSNGSSATETLDKRIKTAVAKTIATPRKPKPWADLARLRYQRAAIDGIATDGTYTDDGKQRLSEATGAWERYLALDPDKPDARLARLMTQAYGQTGLNQPTKALQAFQIVTAAEKPPNSNLFAQLAQLAYQAGDTRTGDLAASRAVDLAPKDKKKLLRTTLKQLKTQGQPQPTQSAPVQSK